MHFSNSLQGLSGAAPIGVYSKYAAKVAELWRTPAPSPTGTRPNDALIFSDPYGYLRVVLNNSDWDGVSRWYATQITEILKTSTSPPDFWNLSKLNVQNYCDRTLNLSDLRAFTEKCILVMCIADYGNKVGFGYAGKRDDLNLAMFFDNGLSHNDGQLNWQTSFDAAKAGQRYGFCIGWVKEPAKHTASRIIVAIGAAFIGGAAFQAISTAANAASAAATTSATAAGSAAASVVPAGIETVTVVAAAPAITAGSVAAGLSAGAVAVATAPPPLSAPPIETVTVIGSAPSAGISVGQALTAGAIATAVTAPALLTPSIETVTVEAPRVEEHPVSAAETAATGLVSVGIQYPAISAGNPPNPQYSEDSLTDRIKEHLQDAAEEYGSQWIKDHLQEWLTDELGRTPTQTEYEQYQDIVDPYSPLSLMRKYLPIILGALLIAAIFSRRGN